tara:strand:+ start:500 stop:991 length:492 start_codon:yes stop_codon:yes gene_type:complete
MAELTAKQETFIDHYLTNGGNIGQAYRDSGYKCSTDATAYVGGSKLLRNGKVVDRILVRKKDSVAKQRAKAKRIDIDEQWLLAEYIDTIRLAKADKQYSAVNASITNIARLLSIGFVDKREINQQINIDATLQALDSGALLDALTNANDPAAIEGEYRTVGDD